MCINVRLPAPSSPLQRMHGSFAASSPLQHMHDLFAAYPLLCFFLCRTCHACPACRYKIEQELGTEIKPIPPVIEKGLYCA